jgi:hypothetical protein
MADNLPGPADDVIKEFTLLVLKSPPAVVTLVVSTFFGYGISFVLFDYRRAQVNKSHYLFHVAIGLGYAAVIFCGVNFDLLSVNLTVEQITNRIPLTLLVSFVLAFVIMMAGGIWREFSAPYSAGRTDGDGH